MDPYTQYLQAIATEIANDPANLGYAGKTPSEQMDLMNNSYTIMVPQEQTPRIAFIINQIPFAPNTVTTQDIIDSANPTSNDVAVADEIGKAVVQNV